ncbi:Beta-crystallin B2, partial [Pygoscelis adeliae]
QIAIFEQENFQGRCHELSGACPNLKEAGVEKVGSILVHSGPYVPGGGLGGRGGAWEGGRGWDGEGLSPLPAIPPRQCCRAASPAHPGGGWVPGGASGLGCAVVRVMVRDPRACLGRWVGYQYPGYRGYQYLFEKGDYKDSSDFGAQHPQIQSVRRIRDMQWHQRGAYHPTN